VADKTGNSPLQDVSQIKETLALKSRHHFVPKLILVGSSVYVYEKLV
jgi:hypothetical protein